MVIKKNIPSAANIASKNILLHFMHSFLKGQQTTNPTYTKDTWADKLGTNVYRPSITKTLPLTKLSALSGFKGQPYQ